MQCPNCGRSGRDDARFCDGCGAALAQTCPRCDRELRAEARFCDGCGADQSDGAAAAGGPAPEPAPREPRAYTPAHLVEKILQSKAALEGERKQVTVLFADLKGSMEMAEQVGPETWHGLLDRFFSILAEGVHRFEGTVNQYTGDGIMALFGAPIAHEDHAQRACYAALWLRDALQSHARDVKREHGLSLSVRMGVHSGDVVVGKIGDDLRMDYTAQGHTVGLAQRMEDLAEPNTCYVSGGTAALVGGYFDLEDLGEFRVKGSSEPVNAHLLRGLGKVRTRFDASRARGLTRFVGRDSDMRTLEDALATADAGRGQVVGVVAEAGTGKSRLCFEFVERCRARGMRVIEGQAVAHGRNLPYLPMLQVFRAYYGVDEGDDDRTVREKIAGRLLLIDESFRELLPVLFEFFGVPDPENPVPPIDPDAKKRQLFGVLRTLAQRDATGHGPFVTLIEDLHWMDEGSEEFLAEWVDAIGSAGRLLVVNFRPEYHADWMQKSWYRQLPLAPLGPDAIRELLDDLLGHDPSTRGLAEAIHARTGGNPFFTEEVVQSLIESGQLEGRRGDYRLVTPVAELEVPATVQPLLASRIDRLAEREKRVLQIAAVIGKEFSEPVLARVAELGEGELGSALEALKHGEFVYETAIYPVAEYAFKHPLTQEVALNTQLGNRRSKLHAAVARVTEELHAEKLDDHAALLAHHWEQAGEPIVAAAWHRRAAERVGGSDMAAGRRHWEQVRRLTAGRGDDDEAAKLATQAHVGLLSLGFRLGLGDAEKQALVREGRVFAERAGDVELSIRLESAASANYVTAGECARAFEHALAGEALAEHTADPELRANARYPAAYVWFNTGPLDRAAERLDETIEAARRAGDLRPLFGGEPMLSLLLQLRAQTEVLIGDVERAYAILDESLRVAREKGLPESIGWASGAYAFQALIDGDVERALPHSRRALEVAERLGSPFSIAHALTQLGMMLTQSGDPSSLEVAERAVKMARGHNTALEAEGWHLAALAEACTFAGDVPRALDLADEAIAVCERRGTQRNVPFAAIAKFRAQCRREGPPDLAAMRDALDLAVDSAQRIQATTLVAVASLERANLAAIEGRADERTRWLRDARERFARANAHHRVAEIDAMLEASA